MTSLPVTLRNQLKVQPSADPGHVDVTVTLPSDAIRDYVQLLESLSNLLQFAKRQAHYADVRAKVKSDEYAQECQQRIADYQFDLATRYDRYIDQGLTRKEAIKRISEDLKSENHPWHYADQVRANLIAAGRSGRAARPGVQR